MSIDSIPSLGSVILESKITPDHPYQKQEVDVNYSLELLKCFSCSQCNSSIILHVLYIGYTDSLDRVGIM